MREGQTSGGQRHWGDASTTLASHPEPSPWTTSSPPKQTPLNLLTPSLLTPALLPEQTLGDAGGEVTGHPAGLGAAGSSEVFAVPCSKLCSFLSPVALNSCFCLLGLKAWKWLWVAQWCQEERAQGGVGAPSLVTG